MYVLVELAFTYQTIVTLSAKLTKATTEVHTGCHNYAYLHSIFIGAFIGPNCPGIFGTVTDFIGPSRILDSFIIVPEVEERRAIKPLVAQRLALCGEFTEVLYV